MRGGSIAVRYAILLCRRYTGTGSGWCNLSFGGRSELNYDIRYNIYNIYIYNILLRPGSFTGEAKVSEMFSTRIN